MEQKVAIPNHDERTREIIKIIFCLFLGIFIVFPIGASAGRLSEPEELVKLINKISERQSKNLKQFEKKTKAYFFDTQKPETVEGLLKEFQPGETITILVFSNLSKKPANDIVVMKKAGVDWPDMAAKMKINLKAVVKEVKDFRLGIG